MNLRSISVYVAYWYEGSLTCTRKSYIGYIMLIFTSSFDMTLYTASKYSYQTIIERYDVCYTDIWQARGQ